jgi:hypothetical protein
VPTRKEGEDHSALGIPTVVLRPLYGWASTPLLNFAECKAK